MALNQGLDREKNSKTMAAVLINTNRIPWLLDWPCCFVGCWLPLAACTARTWPSWLQRWVRQWTRCMAGDLGTWSPSVPVKTGSHKTTICQSFIHSTRRWGTKIMHTLHKKKKRIIHTLNKSMDKIIQTLSPQDGEKNHSYTQQVNGQNHSHTLTTRWRKESFIHSTSQWTKSFTHSHHKKKEKNHSNIQQEDNNKNEENKCCLLLMSCWGLILPGIKSEVI